LSRQEKQDVDARHKAGHDESLIETADQTAIYSNREQLHLESRRTPIKSLHAAGAAAMIMSAGT
jgi:hypothetical protein